MSALGGVGQQVAGDIFEIGKSVVKGTSKVLTDTVGETIEQVLSAPVGAVGFGKKEKKFGSEDREKEAREAQKKQIEKRKFQEVKGELAEYIERKKQLDAQIAQERARDEKENNQKKSYEKQKKESFFQQLMRRIGGASHGETDRQKE